MTGRGPNGKSLYQVVEEVVRDLGIATAKEIYGCIVERFGTLWSEDGVMQNIMASTRNLKAGHVHWKAIKRFLWHHEDDRFEIYQPEIHGK